MTDGMRCTTDEEESQQSEKSCELSVSIFNPFWAKQANRLSDEALFNLKLCPSENYHLEVLVNVRGLIMD